MLYFIALELQVPNPIYKLFEKISLSKDISVLAYATDQMLGNTETRHYASLGQL